MSRCPILTSYFFFVLLELKEELEAVVQAVSCNDYCERGSNGGGKIIGTAPFCGSNCGSDCNGLHALCGLTAAGLEARSAAAVSEVCSQLRTYVMLLHYFSSKVKKTCAKRK